MWSMEEEQEYSFNHYKKDYMLILGCQSPPSSFSLFIFIMFMPFLLFLSSLYLMDAHSSSSLQHPVLCRDTESSALLHFKQGFRIDEGASGDPSPYPKVAKWESHNDCCTWDGVECDRVTGHVIGLHLGRSYLSGSITSNSTLFTLVHLHRLDLSHNDFHGSQIPNAIGHLWRLKSLNLCYSHFSGQIPLELLSLSKLVFLDLSESPMLQLQNPGLGNLAPNFTRLKILHLSQVNISSTIPHALANLTSLLSLHLVECGLQGKFPVDIFRLPNLQYLDVTYNPELAGYLPEFQEASPLRELYLSKTSFSGKLPASIGTLSSLTVLGISSCNFIGPVPSSLGHLRQLSTLDLSKNSFRGQISSFIPNLTQLTFLSLRSNNFRDGDLAWLRDLTKLHTLNLRQSNLNGEIPSSLLNMSQLAYLNLGYNELSGQIPSWLMNLTQLTLLDLGHSMVEGGIPSSLFELQNLRELYLSQNQLNGTVELKMLSKLKNLHSLQLSDNKLSLLNYNDINITLPKFKVLGLGACNLTEIPEFLRNQDELVFLWLHRNNIHGQIPKWMWGISKTSLQFLKLGGNNLTGFDPTTGVLPWSRLRFLDIKSNMLQGPLPVPPPTINFYSVARNQLSGKFPNRICNLSSLLVLDLSSNSFSGRIPQCLASVSSSLSVLNLSDNNLHGSIPQTWTKTSNLILLDLSENKLQGKIPRSLANCVMLEEVDLGNNMIKDTFPFWLGSLPKLQILILSSNLLHGAIGKPKTKFDFPRLRIFDLSYNEFVGDLPLENFKNLDAMKLGEEPSQFKYMKTNSTFLTRELHFYAYYKYSMTVTNKGLRMFYEKISNIFTAIDFSNNHFIGQIPTTIGNLNGLHLLNLRGNNLTGHIPSSLGNLTRMESLDLSLNKLSGEIPWELTRLTFLEFLNVSHNQLTGLIPQGQQFATFSNDSFDGNPRLCGTPLSRVCESFGALPPPPTPSSPPQDSESDFDWKFALMGYGSGLVIGVSIGYYLTSWKHEWFMETFGRQQRKGMKKGNRGYRGHRW